MILYASATTILFILPFPFLLVVCFALRDEQQLLFLFFSFSTPVTILEVLPSPPSNIIYGSFAFTRSMRRETKCLLPLHRFLVLVYRMIMFKAVLDPAACRFTKIGFTYRFAPSHALSNSPRWIKRIGIVRNTVQSPNTFFWAMSTTPCRAEEIYNPNTSLVE